MDRKIRTLNEIKKIAADQQFKHVRLCDLHGEAIVSYNPAHGKKPSDVTKKWAEIERRLKQCDPGIYQVQCRARFGGREKAYCYYVGHGNYDPKQLDTPAPAVQIAARNQEPVSDHRDKNKTDKLLSVETALDYATENATLKAENDSMRRQIDELNNKVAELESELDDPERLADGKKNSLVDFFKEASPSLLPIADRVLGLFERKQTYNESKLLAENGYQIPGLTKKTNGQTRRQAAPKRDFNANVPEPGDADWNEYVKWAGELGDDEFNAHLELVEKASQTVYTELCKELGVEFSDEGEN